MVACPTSSVVAVPPRSGVLMPLSPMAVSMVVSMAFAGFGRSMEGGERRCLGGVPVGVLVHYLPLVMLTALQLGRCKPRKVLRIKAGITRIGALIKTA